MTKYEVSVAVREVCSETLRIPLDEVLPEAEFVEDLDVDSLFPVQLAVAVEERFGISVPEDEALPLKTVQEMINYVWAKVENSRIEIKCGG